MLIRRLVQKKITGLYGTEFLVFSACFALNNTLPKKGNSIILELLTTVIEPYK